MEMKIGQHVELSLVDRSGRCEVASGVVSRLSPTEVVIRHDDGGVATFPRDEVTTVRSGKPASPKIVPKSPTVVSAPSSRRGATGETKLDVVKRLVSSHVGKSRSEMINLIVAEVGMTPAGASTYYANAKKHLNGERA